MEKHQREAGDIWLATNGTHQGKWFFLDEAGEQRGPFQCERSAWVSCFDAFQREPACERALLHERA